MFNAKRFKCARIAAHIEADTMARNVGVSLATLQKWEQGEGVPTLLQITKSVAFINVAIARTSWQATSSEVSLEQLSPTCAVASLDIDEVELIADYRRMPRQSRIILRGMIRDITAAQKVTSR